MGTLGFLLPFRAYNILSQCIVHVITSDNHHADIDDYTKAIDSAFAGRITVLHRMRLSCTFKDSGGDRIDTHAEGESMPLQSQPFGRMNLSDYFRVRLAGYE